MICVTRNRWWLAAGFMFLAGCDDALDRVANDPMVRESRASAERTAEVVYDPDERERIVEAVKQLPSDIRDRRTPPFK